MSRNETDRTAIPEPEVVVLTCFGELAPFDQIAVTFGASE